MNYLYMQQHKQILRYAEQKKLDRKEFILLWSSLREVLEQAKKAWGSRGVAASQEGERVLKSYEGLLRAVEMF